MEITFKLEPSEFSAVLAAFSQAAEARIHLRLAELNHIQEQTKAMMSGLAEAEKEARKPK